MNNCDLIVDFNLRGKLQALVSEMEAGIVNRVIPPVPGTGTIDPFAKLEELKKAEHEKTVTFEVSKAVR